MIIIGLIFSVFFILLACVYFVTPIILEKFYERLRYRFDHRDRGLGIRHGAIINKKDGKVIPQQHPML